MPLLVEGLSYRGAPLSVRERVFLSGESLRAWLRRLGAKPALSGGAILSTCNRTEFYLTSEDPAAARGDMELLAPAFAAPHERLQHRSPLADAHAPQHLLHRPPGPD